MSYDPSFPTRYPDVNTVLLELLSSAQNILDPAFVGMYLYGSLATGDFDNDSDIDFLVVVIDELGAGMLCALQEMHARVFATGSQWATQLEGSYIPQRALRRHDPANNKHPHIDRGEGTLKVKQHNSDWVIQRYISRERGVTLAGPNPSTLIDPVQPKDLQDAVGEILLVGWAPMLDAPSKVTDRGEQSYAVLTMCRMLYTLVNGSIVSKRVAAKWTEETFGEQWASLIERAWVGRHNPRMTAEPGDVKQTLDLIRYTIERSKQFRR